ncbi:hypothetical protein T02_5844 [Trichinella nativa]|uniref:Uncharacterized protein n=1 Tax=Trichinella nativa TaxID=6335 RepID=A0A0V1LRA9_9BILA|nr:hypothetical protein T02_5844 [Trichinella nativa]
MGRDSVRSSAAYRVKQQQVAELAGRLNTHPISIRLLLRAMTQYCTRTLLFLITFRTFIAYYLDIL